MPSFEELTALLVAVDDDPLQAASHVDDGRVDLDPVDGDGTIERGGLAGDRRLRVLRNIGLSLIGAGVFVLVMRWLDFFWQTAPSVREGGIALHWLDPVVPIAGLV